LGELSVGERKETEDALAELLYMNFGRRRAGETGVRKHSLGHGD